MAAGVYCTREDVKNALDIKETARADAQIDEHIATASRTIEGTLHRPHFFPVTGVRSFDWPNDQYARPWRLWLESNTLISVTSLTAGGVTIGSPDYLLRRSDDLDEPPYDHIELDLSTSAAFSAGDTHQQSIVVTGVWGYSNDETQVGELTAELTASGSAGIELSPRVGVGSILRIDDERLIVVDKTMVDTTQNLGGDLDAQMNDELVPVADGSTFDAGQTILIDAERMLIVDVAGNNLIVKRSWDGSTLAAHSIGADVFALAGFVIDRGQLGTTTAVHDSGTAIWRWDPPPPIRSLAKAEAINLLQQDQSAWGRTVGAGENEREMAGKGLSSLWEQARITYGHQARIGAI